MEPIFDSSNYLNMHWIDRLVEDSKQEADGVDSTWPVKPLGITTRKLVWNLCESLGVHSKGIPGQACRLVEKYIVTRFRALPSSETGAALWEELKIYLVENIALLILSAIQLSAKQMSLGEKVKASAIQKVLKMKGTSYTLTEILKSEFDFFQTLKFRLPLWSSVDIAGLLATELGMPAEMMPGLAIIVDLAEFHRAQIEDALENTAPTHTHMVRSRMTTLDICAGSVVAAARQLNFQGPDPSLRLSEMIRLPCLYIACVSSLILQHIQEDDTEPFILKKRKISSD